jgi:hypothetical protein
MAASGYTPLYIYASGSTGNIPSASNLTNTAYGSEIALNYYDGKIYYKNASNVVTLFTTATSNALTAGVGMAYTTGTTWTGSVTNTINHVGYALNSQTSTYTLVATDAGKLISITTGGVVVPSSVFSAGNEINIYNNSGTAQTITPGSGLTLQWAGQSTSQVGSRTLGSYALVRILFLSASVAIISGYPGLT